MSASNQMYSLSATDYQTIFTFVEDDLYYNIYGDKSGMNHWERGTSAPNDKRVLPIVQALCKIKNVNGQYHMTPDVMSTMKSGLSKFNWFELDKAPNFRNRLFICMKALERSKLISNGH